MLRRQLASVLVFAAGSMGWGASVAKGQSSDWKPSEEIRLACEVGPLGAMRHYEVPPIGTADVFGNGPYDLLVSDRRLLPFKRFTPEGVPVYGQPKTFRSPDGALALFVQDETPCAVVYRGGTMRLYRFNRTSLQFESSEDVSVDVPSGLRTLAAYTLPDDRLAVLFTKGDGKSRGVPGAHPHSAEYRPFDGSGIWRGKLSYAVLGAITFEWGVRVPDVTFPIFSAHRDFLIRCTGLTRVDYPRSDQYGVMGAASQGMFYYFRNDSDVSLELEPAVFLSDADGNGVRHPGIFPSPVALPDPRRVIRISWWAIPDLYGSTIFPGVSISEVDRFMILRCKC